MVGACGEGSIPPPAGSSARAERPLSLAAITEATEADECTMTTWLAIDGGQPKDLPPIGITAVDGDIVRTENNALAWVRGMGVQEGATEAELAELDSLVGVGPQLAINTPEGIFLTRLDLFELALDRDPTFTAEQVGYVSHAELEDSDSEVVGVLSRLNRALGGSMTTNPLEFFDEFGARITETGTASVPDRRAVEACADAIDLVEWFARAVVGPEAEDEMDDFRDEVGGNIEGEFCWQLELDAENRIRRSRSVMELDELFKGELPSDAPEVIAEEIEWSYEPVSIDVPDRADAVDVTDLYVELLESDSE